MYEGSYYEGKKHGRGLYIWQDGSSYDGDWYENRIEGNGIYKWNKQGISPGTIVTDNNNNVIVRAGTSLIKYNAAGTGTASALAAAIQLAALRDQTKS
jgi:hypothetical protein